MNSGDIVKRSKRSLAVAQANGRIHIQGKKINVVTHAKSVYLFCAILDLRANTPQDEIDSAVLCKISTQPEWQGKDFGFDALSVYKTMVGKYRFVADDTLVMKDEWNDDQNFVFNDRMPDATGDRQMLSAEYHGTKMFLDDQYLNTYYYVPWLSLMRLSSASLLLNIDVKKAADYVEFDRNDNFKITPGRFNASESGEYSFTIYCLKEFNRDQRLVIRSYKEVAGQKMTSVVGRLNVWANENVFQLKMVIVYVVIGGVRPVMTQNEKDILVNATKHAHVITLIEEIELNIDEHDRLNEFIIENKKGEKEMELSIEDVSAQAKTADSDSSAPEQEKRYIYLDDMVKFKLRYDHPAYARHLPVFCLPYPNTSRGLGGYYQKILHVIVLFKGRPEIVFAHEALHSLGLGHTFNNSGFKGRRNILFTYQYATTKNIMDYNEGKETYHWQWVAIRRNQLRLLSAASKAVV